MTGTPPLTVPDLDEIYTSQPEIESRFSQLGVTLRLTDQQSTQAPDILLEDIIDDATEETNEYLLPKYLAVDLVISRWVRRRTANIACYLLSTRRGNPGQFKALYNATISSFEKIAAGSKSVPGIPWRGEFTLPHSTNLVVDHRFPLKKLRETPLPPFDFF